MFCTLLGRVNTTKRQSLIGFLLNPCLDCLIRWAVCTGKKNSTVVVDVSCTYLLLVLNKKKKALTSTWIPDIYGLIRHEILLVPPLSVISSSHLYPPLCFSPFSLSLPPTIPSLLDSLHSLRLRIRASGSCPLLLDMALRHGNVCLCVCSSSPFLDPWGAST